MKMWPMNDKRPCKGEGESYAEYLKSLSMHAEDGDCDEDESDDIDDNDDDDSDVAHA